MKKLFLLLFVCSAPVIFISGASKGTTYHDIFNVIRLDDVNAVKKFIANGVDLNEILIGLHRTPLTSVVFWHKPHSTEIISLLIQGGANPNLPDGTEKTPLEYAFAELAIFNSLGVRESVNKKSYVDSARALIRNGAVYDKAKTIALYFENNEKAFNVVLDDIIALPRETTAAARPVLMNFGLPASIINGHIAEYLGVPQNPKAKALEEEEKERAAQVAAQHAQPASASTSATAQEESADSLD